MDGVTFPYIAVVQQCEDLYEASLEAVDIELVYEEHHTATLGPVAASTVITSWQLTTRSLS